MAERTGHCLCGATSFAYAGEENWRGHCHCESCRRASSSAFTTYVGVPDGTWRWTGAAPKIYISSPGTRWLFCATCGSHLAYDADHHPEEIHFFAALLDDAASFVPTAHYHYEERLPWPAISDDLPKKTG
jgi:hypothetical protein